MSRGPWLAALLAAAAGEPTAAACSCAPPEVARLLAPLRIDDAPLNAHLHLAVSSEARAEREPVLELRAKPSGARVETHATYTQVPGSRTDHLELVPTTALQPRTDYLVTLRTPDRWPDTLVLGIFRTGVAADVTAPELDPLAPPELPHATRTTSGAVLRSSCDVSTPWARLEVGARDPGRRTVPRLLAVWLADARGNYDAGTPPTSIIEGGERGFVIGRDSACSPLPFPFPKAKAAWLVVAALDDAGNRSAPQKVRVPLEPNRAP